MTSSATSISTLSVKVQPPPSASATITLSLSNNVVQTIVVPIKTSLQTIATASADTTSTGSSTATISAATSASSTEASSVASTTTLTTLTSSTSTAILSPLSSPSAEQSPTRAPIIATSSSGKPSPATSSALTTSTRIGLGVSIGIGVPILLLLIAILFLLIRRSRKQQRDLTEIDQKLAEPTVGHSRPDTAAGHLRGNSQPLGPVVAELEGTQVQVPIGEKREEPTFSNDAHWKRILEDRLDALQIGRRRLSEIEDDETEGMKKRFSGATEDVDDPQYRRISRYSDPETRLRNSGFHHGSSTPPPPDTAHSDPNRLQIPRFPSPYPNDPDLLGYGRMMTPSPKGSQRIQRKQRFSGWSDNDDDPIIHPLQPSSSRQGGYLDSSSVANADSIDDSGSVIVHEHRHQQQQQSSDHWPNNDEIDDDDDGILDPYLQASHRYTTLSEEQEEIAAAAAAAAADDLSPHSTPLPLVHYRRAQHHQAEAAAEAEPPELQQQRQEEPQQEDNQENLQRFTRWSDATTHPDDSTQNRFSAITAQSTTRIQTLSSLDSDDLRTGSPVTQEDMDRWQHYGRG